MGVGEEGAGEEGVGEEGAREEGAREERMGKGIREEGTLHIVSFLEVCRKQ